MYIIHCDVADSLENHIVLHANNNKINQPKHAAHLIRDKRFFNNNVVCATSKASDQPALTRNLIRAFASRLIII